MIVGKVVGSVVSTRKNENLVGCKFMVVEPIAELGNPSEKFVAVDNVGAGIGEMVLVATGSAARIGCSMQTSPIDAAIVGIIDNGTGLAGVIN
jgi:ethanolamine utilization protein EutN